MDSGGKSSEIANRRARVKALLTPERKVWTNVIPRKGRREEGGVFNRLCDS